MASVSKPACFLKKYLAVTSTAIALAALPSCLLAQTAAPALVPTAYSSSHSDANTFAGEDLDGSSLASAPDGSIKTIAPQYGGGYGGGRYHRYSDTSGFSHFAFEAGGGFTAPIGNVTSGGFTSIIGDGFNYPSETYGGNYLIGGGWNFTKRFGVLGEFAFDTNKIPGRTLSAFYNEIDPQVGLSSSGIANIGGNVHTYSVTAEPTYYYYNGDKHSFAGYVIGGGGWYHKSTNFTAPVEEEGYFGGVFVTNQTFTSYSDNALGGNLGTGVSVKPFGQYSSAKLFLEARYVFVNTPRETAADAAAGNLHTGTEELIPVTIGIRF